MDRYEHNYPTILFSDDRCAILLADMTGDGLADIVRVRYAEVCYWPNLGRGLFGKQIRLRLSQPLDTNGQFDPKRVHLFDLDGSGTNDLVYADSKGTLQVHFNQSGNSLSAPLMVATLPPCWPGACLSVADLLGNGTGCLVWSALSGVVKNIPLLKYLDLLGGKKPHVLKRVVNNLGAETVIHYASSTKFFLRDKAAGRPWLTKLPFPVQVIERVATRDEVSGSKLVTRYAYRHGYYDGKEREYRGFARVDQWDAETFCEGVSELITPPTRTVSWFHTGAWLDKEPLERELSKEYYAKDPRAPLLADTGRLLFTSGKPILSAHQQIEAVRAFRGQLLRQEIYGEDGTAHAKHPYLVKELDYEAVQYLAPKGSKDKGVTFVHPVNTLSLHYERRPKDPRMTQEAVLEVDAFGNATLSAAIGYPRRASDCHVLEPEQQKTWIVVTENRFANHPSETSWYRIGVPIESATCELTGLTPPLGGLFSATELRSQILAASEIPYEATPTTGVQKRAVERQRQLYAQEYATGALARADAKGALPLGTITERAIPHQTLRLAFTPGLLSSVYGAAQPTEAELRLEGGYTEINESWWAQSGRIVLDPERFYTPMGAIDPFGKEHHVEYDAHSLLPVDTRDPLENRTTVGIRGVETVITYGNDYRILAPTWITDPNGNQKRVECDAFGRVTKAWQMGKYCGSEGDNGENPGAVFRYDSHAWHEGRGPASVHAAIRENHRQGGLPFDEQGKPTRLGFQHSKTWTDGFGREVMTKAQAEAGKVPTFDAEGRLAKDSSGNPIMVHSTTRWVGSGRTVFDNKGNPVKKYEPFFSGTLDYEKERELVEWGVTPILRYDPLGRLIRTEQPNGTYAEVRFDAWRQENWDENDTVTSSRWYADRDRPDPTEPQPTEPEPRAAWLAAKHAGTPKVETLDSLGRVFLIEEDSGDEPAWTWLQLDVEGNTLSVTDARGNEALSQTYDVLGRPIRTASADAGVSLALFDAKDKPIRTRDMRGYVRRHVYDALDRPTHLYVRYGDDPEKLLECLVYGEGHNQSELLNLRTRPYLAFDSAGVRMSARYDFKGNALEVVRRLTREIRESADWTPLSSLASISAIEAAAKALLEDEELKTTAAFDALGRVTTRTTPDASVTKPMYNEAGLLDAVSANVRGAQTPRTIVQNIDYNARGQREAIAYGNGTATTYAYDPKTFRLMRQVTTRNGEDALQDLAYTFDPVGNVVEMHDAVSYGNDKVSADGRYEYDALYRLTKAEGREHPGQQVTDVDALELGLPTSPHANDWQALRRYSETYFYDATGNILSMAHESIGTSDAWTRRYQYDTGSNRLIATSAPKDAPDAHSLTYGHDAAGNMTRMPHLPQMDWDHANRLVKVKKQVGGSDPNEVCFAYDATGQRVRKAYVHSGYIEERLYLGDYEVYRKRELGAGKVQFERQTLHVMDGASRVAMLETKTIDTSIAGYVSDPVPLQRYQLGNHLGSSSMELAEDGAVISCEEYFPYGGTAFQATASEVSAKPYRYTGKERDEETGLYYHGARYYAAWLGRWTAADPAGFVDGVNLYTYVADNPVRYTDPAGKQLEPRSISVGPTPESGERPADAPAPKVVVMYTHDIFESKDKPQTKEERIKYETGLQKAIMGLKNAEGQRLDELYMPEEVVMVRVIEGDDPEQIAMKYGASAEALVFHGHSDGEVLAWGTLESRSASSNPTEIDVNRLGRLAEQMPKLKAVFAIACNTADKQPKMPSLVERAHDKLSTKQIAVGGVHQKQATSFSKGDLRDRSTWYENVELRQQKSKTSKRSEPLKLEWQPKSKQ